MLFERAFSTVFYSKFSEYFKNILFIGHLQLFTLHLPTLWTNLAAVANVNFEHVSIHKVFIDIFFKRNPFTRYQVSKQAILKNFKSSIKNEYLLKM